MPVTRAFGSAGQVSGGSNTGGVCWTAVQVRGHGNPFEANPEANANEPDTISRVLAE